MEMSCQVQILGKAVTFLFFANALRKNINPSLLPPAINE